MRIIIKIFLVSILFTSCKTYNLFETKEPIKDTTTFSYDANYQYRIRKDDKISLSVWGEEGLSVGSVYGIYDSNEVYGKWLLVDANGNIEIPKIGTTNVVNKTVPELKEYIKNQLKKWIINPIIDVKVLNKEITVLGEVRNPNVITVDKDHNSLIEMISKTGGFEFYANLRAIKILRQEGENVRVTNIDLTNPDDIRNRNIQLYPGDVVIVPSKKNKEFDKRISIIIPFTSTITAAAILIGLF
ncbi:polysaccharide export protein [Flavobacterium sp. ZT3R18]|uniref:polysaccharide biosynthesis/export family protein n=1 Tax=Flavobacterium sp. ZT3R18 TaxID=2594429 RepID=UPI00117A42EC|nr:polysaccharide biosynthesis/export family protein [Flavobacterium sp. ZT3R18]TRX36171.1 polysaccharide export protein [Flavobacterium sp. ZT3R18]